MKKNKFIIISLISIVLIIIVSLFNVQNIIDFTVMQIARRMEAPIDLNTNTINNKYFGIYSNGEKAESTTNGINEAIEYAYENNIEYIKFEKGTYLISGKTSRQMEPSGIILKSNLTLDLNGSTIKQEKNNSEAYINVNIQDCENIRVCNGIIIGDRPVHEFVQNSESQWGMAIYIKNANNILIDDLEIYDAIGDGVCISGGFENSKNSTNDIIIENCKIYNNRRQGISVISGNNIKIINNEIHNIGGSPPHTGIDLEPNGRWQRVSNISIENNKIYILKSNRAISVNAYVENVDINANEINGGIYCQYIDGYISIENNDMKSGALEFRYYQQYHLENVIIKNNNLQRNNIIVEGCKNLVLENNNIDNSYINIYSSNCFISSNNIKYNGNNPLKLGVRQNDSDNIIYNANISNNKLNNNIFEAIIESPDRYNISN